MADGHRLLHPSATAGRGERIGQTSRYRCKQCGFPVDARKRSNRSPENVTDGIVVSGTYGEDSFSVDAKAGCPQCGSFNWSQKAFNFNKNRPQRPRFKPGSNYRRKYERF